ncbi:hypothetical protein NECID01_0997 [Nematocida sp. AWRm77]|nr:hypothetical protein NECID01_0997 [Nematocida sp. AWRm77]
MNIKGSSFNVLTHGEPNHSTQNSAMDGVSNDYNSLEQDSSYYQPSYNGATYNRASYNGASYNGATYNGATYNGASYDNPTSFNTMVATALDSDNYCMDYTETSTFNDSTAYQDNPVSSSLGNSGYSNTQNTFGYLDTANSNSYNTYSTAAQTMSVSNSTSSMQNTFLNAEEVNFDNNALQETDPHLVTYNSTETDAFLNTDMIQSSTRMLEDESEISVCSTIQKQKTPMIQETLSVNTNSSEELLLNAFNRLFKEETLSIGLNTNIIEYWHQTMRKSMHTPEFAKLSEKLLASKKWIGHNIFWRLLVEFLNKLSLELSVENIQNNSTATKRREATIKLTSPNTDTSHEMSAGELETIVSNCKGVQKMKIECNLKHLSQDDAMSTLSVFRWLLHHVGIQYLSICHIVHTDLRLHQPISLLNHLTQDSLGNMLYVESLFLEVHNKNCESALQILKEYSYISELSITTGKYLETTTIDPNSLGEIFRLCSNMETLLLPNMTLCIDTLRECLLGNIKLKHLEIYNLLLESKDQINYDRKTSFMSLPFLTVEYLKVAESCSYFESNMRTFVLSFPNLKSLDIVVKGITLIAIGQLSSLCNLTSLAVRNHSLINEHITQIVHCLPNLTCLFIYAFFLDESLARALFRASKLHTLNIQGNYIAGFLKYLFQQPLVHSLKSLNIYRSGPITAEFLSPKDKEAQFYAKVYFNCIVSFMPMKPNMKP